MKTLVTGATGFLGSALARRLVRDDVQVRAIRRPDSRLDLLQDVSPSIDWVIGDVLDPETLAEACRGISTVFHTAAYLGFNGRHDRRKLMDVNVRGTANVVNAALTSGVERLVHTSSIAALGDTTASSDCLDETAEWKPSPYSSGYGESKYLAELEIHRGIAEGLDAVIVNPSLIMGEGRRSENTRLLLEKIRSESVPFMPTGATNVVDVLDVVDGQLRALATGTTGERYILGGENLTWRAIITELAAAMHVSPPKVSIPMALAMPLAVAFEAAGLLTRRQPVVTRETVRRSASRNCFRNDKAVRELGCTFRPFAETALRLAALK